MICVYGVKVPIVVCDGVRHTQRASKTGSVQYLSKSSGCILNP